MKNELENGLEWLSGYSPYAVAVGLICLDGYLISKGHYLPRNLVTQIGSGGVYAVSMVTDFVSTYKVMGAFQRARARGNNVQGKEKSPLWDDIQDADEFKRSWGMAVGLGIVTLAMIAAIPDFGLITAGGKFTATFQNSRVARKLDRLPSRF